MPKDTKDVEYGGRRLIWSEYDTRVAVWSIDLSNIFMQSQDS